MPSPSEDDQHDLLLSCRSGDVDDVQRFVDTFSVHALDAVHDDNGNTVLHMAAANGHTDVLAYLLPRVRPSLLAHRNRAGSTPLHWAAVNRHLDVARALVDFSTGPGADLIDIKNEAGRSPLGEAELAGWDEGARWFVQVMNLGNVEEVEEEADVEPSQAIEVEIRDAEGQTARMTIDADQTQPRSGAF